MGGAGLLGGGSVMTVTAFGSGGFGGAAAAPPKPPKPRQTLWERLTDGDE